MKKVTPVALVAILGLVPIFAQVATHVPNEPRFDVVSIKKVPADGLPTGNSVRVGPDGGVSLSALPVGTLVRMAYPPRGKVYDFVGLPEWATRDRYDVIATASSTPNDVPAMMQAMLADRFQLVVHTEKRQLPVYDLILARSDGRLGRQMTPIEADCEAKLAADRAARQAAIAAGTTPPSFPDSNSPPPPCTLRVIGKQQGKVYRLEGEGPMSSLESLLRLPGGRLIVDKTGLKGSYRMHMEFSLHASIREPQVTATDADEAPTVFAAVREQLGLKLEPSKALGDVLVVDRVEPPTEN